MDERVIGCDLYNFQITGDTACTINANSGTSANHAGPTLVVLNDQCGGVMDERVIGIDLYNQTTTGSVSKTLNSIRSDSDHVPVVCFSIGSMNSAGMLSSNPHAGIHETNVARTIDANGSNPAGYQGGNIVVQRKQNFQVESIGHDIRSTQFSRNGCCDTLTANDYKEPGIVCYEQGIQEEK